MLATQDVYSPTLNDLRRERLIQSRRVIDLQEIAFARDAAEFAASDAWDEDGSVSAIDWMRFNCQMNAGAAANSIAVGEMLEKLPESHQAVVDGEIGFAHLATMARTAEALRERFDEHALAEKAKESSPGKFFTIFNHARHAAGLQWAARSDRWGASGVSMTTVTWRGGRQMPWSSSPQVAERRLRSRSPAHSRPCSPWRAHRLRRWSTRCLSPPRPSSVWPATPASRASCSTPSRK